MEEQQLTKKERRELKKQQRALELQKREQAGRMKKLVMWVVVLGLVVGGGYKLLKSVTAGKPGEVVADIGREHVTDISQVAYNSNPPTSGPHYAEWTKRGMYEEEIEDGYLIHSLEHGYVIVSYKCEGECEQLKSELKNFYEKYKTRRLIVVPRADLKTQVAMTAWGRLEVLPEWDGKRAEGFLKAFENQGPEKTME